MTKDEYAILIYPAIEKAIEHFIENESQYGEGLTLGDMEFVKSAGHSIAAYRGLDNPDGVPHGVAALSRAIKGVLKEIGHD